MAALPKSQVRADIRGFSYALAPYVQQQEWLLDRTEAKLAETGRELAERRRERVNSRTLLNQQSNHLQDALGKRIDAVAHRRGLEFLAGLQKQLLAQEAEISRVVALQQDQLTECIRLRQKLEGLAKHRERAIDDYAIESARLDAAEADRDWVARLQLRKLQPGMNASLEKAAL